MRRLEDTGGRGGVVEGENSWNWKNDGVLQLNMSAIFIP